MAAVQAGLVASLVDGEDAASIMMVTLDEPLKSGHDPSQQTLWIENGYVNLARGDRWLAIRE